MDNATLPEVAAPIPSGDGQRKPRLWQQPDFVKLWTGQTVSKFGTHITHTALAVTALLFLRATPAQMGLLGAIGSAAFLLIGLFVGAWVDRLRRRPILILADLGRALALSVIPILFLFGKLRIEAIYVMAGLTGILDVFFNVADRAFLPSVVSRDNLVEANSKLGMSDSVAEIAGPSLAGLLVQWLSAPFAICIDIATYLVSAASLGLIRAHEPARVEHEEREPILHEIREGWQVIRHNRLLCALAAALASLTFFGNFIGALYWLYLVRELHLPPFIVGLAVGCGGIGALLGAWVSDRLSRRRQIGKTIWGCLLLWACLWPILPSIHGSLTVVSALVLTSQLFGDIPIAVFFIHVTSVRQAVIPHRLLGRANASMDFLTQGVGPIGALLGGILGGVIGIRPTLWLSLVGPLLALWFLARSPIRHLSELPTEAG